MSTKATDPDPSHDRRLAYRLGVSAESLAAWWLRLKGYRILAARYKTPLGEIDLVARKGRVLAFVEVKRRANLEAAYDALSFDSSRRISAAADIFIAHHPKLDAEEHRFDLVLIAPRRLPRHIANAFDG